MIFNYKAYEDQRTHMLALLEKEKFFRVIDIGGSMNPWAGKYVTHYLDIINMHEYLHNSGLYTPEVQRAKCFLGDINDSFGWEEVMKDVASNGLFDFAICTQTLEDIRNPVSPLKRMPEIAKAGFISVPHKWRELGYVESHDPNDQATLRLLGPYLGYFHHRWIFTIIIREVPILRLFPKLAFVERLDTIHELKKLHEMGNEMSFFWKDSIEYEVVNNDYLGPDPQSVFDLYRNLIEEGL